MIIPPLRQVAAILIALSPTAAEMADDVDESADSMPPSISLEGLRRSVQATRQKLTSLKASFSSWQRENLGTTRCERYVVAAGGPRRYAMMWHGEEDGPETDQRSYIQFYDSINWNVYGPYFRRFDVSRRFAVPPYTNKIRLHSFFECLGWWPPDDPSSPVRSGARRYFLHEVLEDERCRVVLQERIDGTWCHLVEIPGVDRLWINADRGVLVRRQLIQPGGKGELLATYELSDYRLVGEGLFLPYRIRRVYHPVSTDIVTLVDRYEVNGVRAALFRLEPPPGTLIYDRDTDEYSQVPGGFEIMDRVLRWAREQGPDPARSRKRPLRDERLRDLAWILAGAAGYWVAKSLVRRKRVAGGCVAKVQDHTQTD